MTPIKLSTKQIVIRLIPYIALKVLIEEHALSKFIKNLDNFKPTTGRLRLIADKNCPSDAIVFAFNWWETPEDYQFWDRISEKVTIENDKYHE